MALPRTPEQWEAAKKAILEWPAKVHAEEIRMLGQWVSGLEPVVVYRYSGVIEPVGVTAKGFRTIDRFLDPCPVIIKAWK